MTETAAEIASLRAEDRVDAIGKERRELVSLRSEVESEAARRERGAA
jgi:hypothetical protein